MCNRDDSIQCQRPGHPPANSEAANNFFDFVMSVWGPEGVPPSATPSFGEVAGDIISIVKDLIQ